MKKEVRKNPKLKTNFVLKKSKPIRNNLKRDNMKETETILEI